VTTPLINTPFQYICGLHDAFNAGHIEKNPTKN
jgi:hypothetical protein